MSKSQGYNEAGMISSNKNSTRVIGNRTRDLPFRL
jgi:hypothetical protein